MSSEDLRRLSEAILDLRANPIDLEAKRRLCTVLYERLRFFLLGTINRLVPSFLRTDLDDLLQSALYTLFLDAVRLCEEGKLKVEAGDESLEAYFRVVAGNAIRDQVKRAAKRRGMLPLQEDPLTASPPEERLQREEQDSLERKELAAAMLRLPKNARRVVEMRLEGHSFAEIARELRCNVGAVRVRLSRAVKQLQQFLRPSPEADS